MTERWLPIPGYEGTYEVSDHGRVRSLPRRVIRSDGRPRTIHGGILSPVSTDDGRVTVTLPGTPRRKHKISRLVLTAFVRPPLPGEEACHHPDHDPTNNRLDNLRWDTSSENALDTVRQGRHHGVNKTHCPKGHEYTPDNIYWSGNRRTCKACTLGH